MQRLLVRIRVPESQFFLRKGQLNRHTRYRPATTTRNTATQRSCHSVDFFIHNTPTLLHARSPLHASHAAAAAPFALVKDTISARHQPLRARGVYHLCTVY